MAFIIGSPSKTRDPRKLLIGEHYKDGGGKEGVGEEISSLIIRIWQSIKGARYFYFYFISWTD